MASDDGGGDVDDSESGGYSTDGFEEEDAVEGVCAVTVGGGGGVEVRNDRATAPVVDATAAAGGHTGDAAAPTVTVVARAPVPVVVVDRVRSRLGPAAPLLWRPPETKQMTRPREVRVCLSVSVSVGAVCSVRRWLVARPTTPCAFSCAVTVNGARQGCRKSKAVGGGGTVRIGSAGALEHRRRIPAGARRTRGPRILPRHAGRRSAGAWPCLWV